MLGVVHMQYINYLLSACLTGAIYAGSPGVSEFTLLAWILAATRWFSAAGHSW